MKTPENTEENPDDPKLADERDIQIEYSSDVHPKYTSSNKKLCVRIYIITGTTR
jgi:ribosomal protein L31